MARTWLPAPLNHHLLQVQYSSVRENKIPILYIGFSDSEAKPGTYTVTAKIEAKDMDEPNAQYYEAATKTCTFEVATGSSSGS